MEELFSSTFDESSRHAAASCPKVDEDNTVILFLWLILACLDYVQSVDNNPSLLADLPHKALVSLVMISRFNSPPQPLSLNK